MSDIDQTRDDAPQADSNGATDRIDVAKTTGTPVQTADGTQGQQDAAAPAPADPHAPAATPAGVQPPEGLTPVSGGQPDPQPAGTVDPSAPGGADSQQDAEPDPRTLDADGNPVPDFYAAPDTPPAHDPGVHEMAQRAVQKVGTGTFAKMEHVIGAIARYAHQHPELERVFVQGLLDELTRIEMA